MQPAVLVLCGDGSASSAWLVLAPPVACWGQSPTALAPPADNVNGHQNPTGFKLTKADLVRYNKFLASEAHRLGLAIGLKNGLVSWRLGAEGEGASALQGTAARCWPARRTAGAASWTDSRTLIPQPAPVPLAPSVLPRPNPAVSIEISLPPRSDRRT